MKVILDSSCDLPDDYLKKYDIDIIPVHVNMGDKEYLDRLEITPQEIYNYLKTAKKLPTTSAPNPKEFYDKMKAYEKEHSKIIIGTMSAKVSATYQSAKIAKKRFNEEQIKLLDSKSGSGVLGLLGLTTMKMVEKGFDEKEICEKIDNLRDQSIMMGYIDNIENLMKSGRISKFKYWMGSLMRAKPILTYDDGAITPVTSGTGKRNGISKMVNALLEKADKNLKYDIMITHADDEITAKDIMKTLEKELKFEEKIINFLTPALAIHLGLGTILLSIVPNPF